MKKYDAVANVGSYTDRNGQQKKRRKNIGAVMEGRDGSLYLMLDPTFNPAGVQLEQGRDSVMVNFYAPPRQWRRLRWPAGRRLRRSAGRRLRRRSGRTAGRRLRWRTGRAAWTGRRPRRALERRDPVLMALQEKGRQLVTKMIREADRDKLSKLVHETFADSVLRDAGIQMEILRRSRDLGFDVFHTPPAPRR